MRKISGPGTLDVTIDLLYPESARKWPLTMTLAKMEGSTPSKTLVTIPPRIHESGIITQVLSIGETGEYRLYLSGRDVNRPISRWKSPSRWERHAWYEGLAQFWLMLLLIVAAVLFHVFRKL